MKGLFSTTTTITSMAQYQYFGFPPLCVLSDTGGGRVAGKK